MMKREYKGSFQEREYKDSFQERERSRSPTNPNASGEFYLYLGNIPKKWQHGTIKEFIRSNTTSSIISDDLMYVDMLTDKFGIPKCASLLKFRTKEACTLALNQLRGIDIKGKRLIVIEDSTGKFCEHLLRDNKSNKQKKEESENHPLYGLSKDYLKSLNIELPLINKVFVSNLDSEVDESKLFEVFRLAGNVVSAIIFRNYKKQITGTSRGLAQVIYDHPVEAVQAVSMFHNQFLFDKPMNVKLSNSGHQESLPHGLKDIGPGLGPNNVPLRGVRNYVEMQELQNILSVLINNANAQSTLIPGDYSKDTIKNLNQNIMTRTMPLDSQAENSNSTIWNTNMINTEPNPKSAYNVAFQDTISNLNGQNLMQQLLQGNLGNAAQSLVGGQGFSLTTPTFSVNSLPIVGTSQSLIGTPQPFVGTPHPFVGTPQSFVGTPQSFVGTPQPFVGTPQSLIGSTQSSIGTPQSLHGAPQTMVGRPMAGSSHYGGISSQFNIASPGMVSNDTLKNFDMRNDIQDERMIKSDMVVIENLPSSVTLSILRNKISEVGELKFAEMTGQGSAIVRFMNAIDAKRCIETFDHARVDGQTIIAKYF